MTCSHTKTKGSWQQREDYDTGAFSDVWGEHKVSADYDLDLHRYKCGMCGRIGYYSGAARVYHEDGVKSNITGLDK